MLAHLPLLCLDIDSKNTAASLPWGIVISRHGKSRDPIGNEGGSISKLIQQLGMAEMFERKEGTQQMKGL